VPSVISTFGQYERRGDITAWVFEVPFAVLPVAGFGSEQKRAD
jgi:hypothetical protein